MKVHDPCHKLQIISDKTLGLPRRCLHLVVVVGLV